MGCQASDSLRSSLERPDPTWPYAPGMAVVEAFNNGAQSKWREHGKTNCNDSLKSKSSNLDSKTGNILENEAFAKLILSPLSPECSKDVNDMHSFKKYDEKRSGNAYSWENKQSTGNLMKTKKSWEEKHLLKGMSPFQAIESVGNLLTPSEKVEILNYDEIWFVGRAGTTKRNACHSSLNDKRSFDDPRGNYIASVGDHIAFRYEILGCLGRGSFGQVLKCVDHATSQFVAVKIIRSEIRFQKQAVIEANILQDLSMSNFPTCSIVTMYNCFAFRSHFCIVFEMLSSNLYDRIKATGFVGFPMPLVRSIARQILQTLSVLRQRNIIHADIKPENICLTAPGSDLVKLIDFGSACYSNKCVYSYIQSRFYRAPEIILGILYGPAIDIWSLGCLLPELITGKPLFTGEDEAEQLACIMEVLGLVPEYLLLKAARASIFFDPVNHSPKFLKNKSGGKLRLPGSKKMHEIFRNINDPELLDLLGKCLRWDPEQRYHPDQALHHPWLLGFQRT